MKTIRIGRSADNDIVITDSAISSHHAEITVDNYGTFVLTDYSTNGTGVNGMLLSHSSKEIHYGDLIVFPGNLQLDWNALMDLINSQPAAPAPAPAPMPSYQPEAPSYNYEVPEQPATTNTLSFSQTMREAFSSGLQNALSMCGIFFLALLTCWIPYFGLGVIIALADLPAKYASGQTVSPLYIFESKYRRYMGNYLFTQIFVGLGVLVGTAFMVIPGLVMSLAWSLSYLNVLEKDMNPLAAIQASNKSTYGSKWTMVGVSVVLGVIYSVFVLLVALLAMAGEAGAIIGGILLLIGSIIFLSMVVAMQGSIWKQLNTKKDF